MGLMRKEFLMRQKSSREQELKERLSLLSEKGVNPPKADKDPLVKKLKADIRDSKRRLARIAEIDKRTQEMARIKAEKAAAPKKKEEEGAKAQKAKAAPQEGKAKKPKAPEGGKPAKKAESPEGGKAPTPKKAEKPKEEPVIS